MIKQNTVSDDLLLFWTEMEQHQKEKKLQKEN